MVIVHQIIIPLTVICDIFFQIGVFPNNVKTTKIIAIFKNGDKHCIDKYRPLFLFCKNLLLNSR